MTSSLEVTPIDFCCLVILKVSCEGPELLKYNMYIYMYMLMCICTHGLLEGQQ